jgi:hypothetical protein
MITVVPCVRVCLLLFCGVAQLLLGCKSEPEDPLAALLTRSSDSLFREVIDHPDKYRLQIIYTQIDRDENNHPSFRDYYFNVDSTLYFNPASTVKLPLALLSLEKLNTMAIPGVDKFTPILFDSAFSGQTRKHYDSTAENYLPSIAHFIKKAFLVSDNDAYNRMYEFVGQGAINRMLHAKGYHGTRITHRFVRLTPEENRHSNPVRFVSPDGKLLYSQPLAYNDDPFDSDPNERVGEAHYDWNDSLVHGPMDFSQRNRLPLKDLHNILRAVMFPDAVPPHQRFNLTPDDYTFLYQYLSQFPGETNYPRYDSTEYFDSYVKFFFRDSLHRKLPQGVRVFNKVGWSYGFLTDASYVADFQNDLEFMLSATLYVNSDGVVNDNRYDYATIGHPFLFRLGQLIYEFERNRERKYPPNLSAYVMTYEKRLADSRPTIRDVDN